MLHSETVVLNREKRPPMEAPSLNFQGAQALTRPLSLFVKFTNKYICFRSLFRVGEEWNKDNHLGEKNG